MTNPEPLHIPTIEELRAHVVSSAKPSAPLSPSSAPGECRPATPGPAREPSSAAPLTPLAEALLRQAVLPENEGLGLEHLWRILGVRSGSKKKQLTDELRGRGFLRTERKGKVALVHVYHAGYAYLGLTPPKHKGVGGATHRRIAAVLAAKLKTRGYDVHIEHEIGPARKRTDILALGRQRLAVEIGLSDPRQEARNILAALESGAVDIVLFVAVDSALLRKAASIFCKQPVYRREGHRVRWCLWEEEEEPCDEP